MYVYLVGLVTDDSNPKQLQWRLVGVYTDPQTAEQNCPTIDHFVRPVLVNTEIKHGDRPSPIYFPKVDY